LTPSFLFWVQQDRKWLQPHSPVTLPTPPLLPPEVGAAGIQVWQGHRKSKLSGNSHLTVVGYQARDGMLSVPHSSVLRALPRLLGRFSK
jgi:hypothetical protein